MDSKKKELSKVAEIFGITTRAVRKWFKEGKIEEKYYEKVKYQGGYKYLMHPMGAPEPHRSKWIRKQARENPQANREEVDAEIYAELKNYQREHVDIWINLISKFRDLKGQQLKKALHIYKEENPDVSCSYPTFRRKLKTYEKMGLAGIAPDWGGREGDSKIKDKDFSLFKNYYLKESRPNAESCWELVRGAAFKADRDVSDFPHPRTFKRRLEREIPESARYMARHGKSAWKRKYANYADRDKSSVPAGSCWVSDHRIIDQFVYNEETDKVYRPWITAWYDFKSNKWLSWYLHEEAPNSDHIFQTFKWAVEEFGKPDHIYIDNGKDYRSRDFAGGRKHHTLKVDEQHSRSMISMLGITPHFAIPYNSQAKTIERGFRYFIEYLEKHMPGYAGSYAQDRPEGTTEEINRGEIMQDETLFELFDRFISEKLNRRASQGKEHKGVSPNELFFKERTEKKVPRPESLKLFCMRTSNEVTIMRNGALDSSIGHRYWADWMAGMKGTKVYMRRDVKKYQEAWVFDAETDEFIGKAYMDVTINGLAESDIDRQQMRDKMAEKRREKKRMEAYFKDLERPDPEETLQRSIANEDANEAMRRASGDFLDYDENLKINRMDDVQADEIVHKAKNMSQNGTDDLDDITPAEIKRTNFKNILDPDD